MISPRTRGLGRGTAAVLVLATALVVLAGPLRSSGSRSVEQAVDRRSPAPAPDRPPRSARISTDRCPAGPTEPATVAGPVPAVLARDLAGATADGRFGAVSASVWIEGLGVVLEHAPGERLLPASNQKLVTAAGALELLPADHRLVTRVVASPPGPDGVVTGDLTLVAGGDPTVTRSGDHSLAALARQLRAGGVRRVDGDLVVDAGRHGPARQAPGWQEFHVPTYVGPLSALWVDDNRFRADGPYVTDPVTGNGTAFRDALAGAGIAVGGAVRPGAGAGGEELAALVSPGRDDLVGRMLRDSDNEVAEALVREIGLVVAGAGTTPAGTAAIDAWLASVCLPDLGSNADGSGLSRTNAHSGRDLRRLLHLIDTRPWGPILRAALPVAGRSGTLGARLTGPATNGGVSAKTGTILEGAALSGYARTAGGREVVFSVIGNGPRPAAITGAIDELVTSIVAWPA